MPAKNAATTPTNELLQLQGAELVRRKRHNNVLTLWQEHGELTLVHRGRLFQICDAILSGEPRIGDMCNA
jgi:hypothetical protein